MQEHLTLPKTHVRRGIHTPIRLVIQKLRGLEGREAPSIHSNTQNYCSSLRQKWERSRLRFTPLRMFSNLPWLLHYSLVSDYLCTYHPNQNRPVKDYLFQLSSCHLHYLRGNLTGSLHCTLPYYVGWVQWSPHVVVSIGPKEISINPSPYIAPQGQIQLGLWQSLLSLPESVQSAGSPDSLPSGLRK